MISILIDNLTFLTDRGNSHKHKNKNTNTICLQGSIRNFCHTNCKKHYAIMNLSIITFLVIGKSMAPVEYTGAAQINHYLKNGVNDHGRCI